MKGNALGDILYEGKALRFALPFIVGISLGWQFRKDISSFWYVPGIVCLVLCSVMFVMGRRRLSYASRLFGGGIFLMVMSLGMMFCLRSYNATVVQWPDEAQYHQGVVVSSARTSQQTQH